MIWAGVKAVCIAQEGRLLPLHIVEKRLGVSRDTLYRRLTSGRLHGIKLHGIGWRVSERALHEFLAREIAA